MEKVEMIVAGKRALVDADMVKKMTRKEALVGKAMGLHNGLQNSAVPKTDPIIVPRPPAILVPPTITAEMASISLPFPALE